ncbi:hypothetical protein K2173_015436 [Erythroxylum novogranatense]|uniref:Cytochrome P450 n=1 Tax=Erythroxylum novogranatense TaxID=1862640 RepID=A0AAV8SSE1_9ROSI|nr:hypothetical protein K2173_015436 [Erythroxylum novogranatense]
MELQFPSFPLLIALFSFIFMVLKIWKQSKTSHSTARPLPGPRKLPIIGNMHQLAGSLPHHRFAELSKKYGGIMRLQLGEVTNVVISSPDAAKEVMKTHDINFAQRPFILAASVVTYNLSDIVFAPYGEYWRQLRKICIMELLGPKRVLSFRSIREEEVSNLIAQISSTGGLPFNFSKKLFSLTYGIATRASFGKKTKEHEEFLPVVEELIQYSAGFNLADVFPSIKFLQVIGGMKSRLQQCFKESDSILENIIKDHRAKRELKKPNGEVEEDLVDVLLKLQEKGDLEFPLTTENIKAVILDIFVAGSETSATTTEWVVSELLKNPRVLEKVQQEVRMVFDKNGGVDESYIDQMHYLKLVINETMRLHPPAPLLLPRESREECEINGYLVPAKARVLVNAWAIGRDPKYWTDPETFYPERFLDSPIDYKGNHFEFIPFGAGRRMCPGMSFGIANVELPLAQLLYHFDWKLPGELSPESLDMSELFGATVRRKNDLELVAIPYHPKVKA